MKTLTQLFKPNGVISKQAMIMLIFGWIATLLFVWAMASQAPPPVHDLGRGVAPHNYLPSPQATVAAMQVQLDQGILMELWSSVKVYLEAVFFTTILTLGVTYLSVAPIVRPAASFITYLRFASPVGLTFAFMLIFGTGHNLKVALLTFSMSIFMLTDMRKVVKAIPRERYNHARTLGMKPWRVVWEVVALGTLDQAFDSLRTNAAMGWMILPMVEGLSRSEGGIGVVLTSLGRQGVYPAILGIQIVLFGLGIFQDFLIGVAKNRICPYARLGIEESA